jgi:hypothetical protein
VDCTKEAEAERVKGGVGLNLKRRVPIALRSPKVYMNENKSHKPFVLNEIGNGVISKQCKIYIFGAKPCKIYYFLRIVRSCKFMGCGGLFGACV